MELGNFGVRESGARLSSKLFLCFWGLGLFKAVWGFSKGVPNIASVGEFGRSGSGTKLKGM